MKFDFKKMTEELIPVFDTAGLESINLYEKGLKIEIKEDGSPVSNGDLKVNDLISKKRIVGHSDIAPERKTDPGVYFEWNKYLDNV